MAQIYSDPAKRRELTAYATSFRSVHNNIDANDLIQEAMTRALNYNQPIDNPIGLLKRIMRHIIYDKSRQDNMICRNQHLIINKFRGTNESDIADDYIQKLTSSKISTELRKWIASLPVSKAAFVKAMLNYPDEPIVKQAERAQISERTAYRLKKEFTKNSDLRHLFDQIAGTDHD